MYSGVGRGMEEKRDFQEGRTWERNVKCGFLSFIEH